MYLRIDEEAEVANAMKMAAQFAAHVHEDPHLWRWIIIAMHNAAQGTMVLSLRHGNGLLALSDECYTAWMQAYEKHESPPPEKLDTYLGQYKKVKHSRWGQVGGNKRFVPTGCEGKDIKYLNSPRNEFIHFTPKGWSLELDGLPRICLSATRLNSFLAFETENVFWHSGESRRLTEQYLSTFSRLMNELNSRYAKCAA